MHIFFSREISSRAITLPEDESYHCIKVLRLKKGDEAGVLDGNGNFFKCLISEPGSKKIILEIHEKEYTDPDPWHIHAAIAPTKNMSRVEWFAEKAAELGVHEISFLSCARSERKIIKIDRLDKILISSMKQCKNRYLPVVHPIMDFTQFVIANQSVANKFICHISDSPREFLYDAVLPGGNYILLIGPEGDFDAHEIELAVKFRFLPVSLGKNILRTETAGIAGIHILNLVNQIRK